MSPHQHPDDESKPDPRERGLGPLRAQEVGRLAALEPALPPDGNSKQLLSDLLEGNWRWLTEFCLLQLRSSALLLDHERLVIETMKRMAARVAGQMDLKVFVRNVRYECYDGFSLGKR